MNYLPWLILFVETNALPSRAVCEAYHLEANAACGIIARRVEDLTGVPLTQEQAAALAAERSQYRMVRDYWWFAYRVRVNDGTCQFNFDWWTIFRLNLIRGGVPQSPYL